MTTLNWIIRKNDTIIGYVQGTCKAVTKYLNELYNDDSNSKYSATGCKSEFIDIIKYKVLD